LKHIGTNSIETERLLLRRFQFTDDDTMLKYWIADEKIQSMYAEPVYTTKEAIKELLTKYITSYNKEDFYRWAIVFKDSNVASKRVIEKCEFIYEGTLRDYFYMDREYVGRQYFSMLESEYAG